MVGRQPRRSRRQVGRDRMGRQLPAHGKMTASATSGTEARGAEGSSQVHRQRISVAVRLRPMLATELRRGEACVGTATSAPGLVAVRSDEAPTRRFAFDHTFDDGASQGDLYETIGAPLVENVLLGYPATLVAYGQTGSGKSYTLGFLDATAGGTRLERSGAAGLVPRALTHLFESLAATDDGEWTVHISSVQLYCDEVFDLLADSSHGSLEAATTAVNGAGEVPPADSGARLPALDVREDPDRGFYVQDLSSHRVRTLSEAAVLLQTALANRMVASNRLNITSSRSHVLFRVRVKRRLSSNLADRLALSVVDAVFRPTFDHSSVSLRFHTNHNFTA